MPSAPTTPNPDTEPSSAASSAVTLPGCAARSRAWSTPAVGLGGRQLPRSARFQPPSATATMHRRRGEQRTTGCDGARAPGRWSAAALEAAPRRLVGPRRRGGRGGGRRDGRRDRTGAAVAGWRPSRGPPRRPPQARLERAGGSTGSAVSRSAVAASPSSSELRVRVRAGREVLADGVRLVRVERAGDEQRREVADLVAGRAFRVVMAGPPRRLERRRRAELADAGRRSASRTRLFTVPSGRPVRSAISDWVRPPK